MRTVYKLTLATAATALGIATPASAATVLQLCGSGASCVTGTTNVNIVASTDVQKVVGNVGIGGPEVDFTSTDTIHLDGIDGAAKVQRTDGSDLTQITFALLTGTFSAAEFNFEQGSPKAFDVTLSASDGSSQLIHLDNANGSNVFDVFGTAGEAYTSASIVTTNGSFKDFKQLRLVLSGTPFNIVPEPKTWALMLLGFGGIGMALRRNRKRNPALLQVA